MHKLKAQKIMSKERYTYNESFNGNGDGGLYYSISRPFTTVMYECEHFVPTDNRFDNLGHLELRTGGKRTFDEVCEVLKLFLKHTKVTAIYVTDDYNMAMDWPKLVDILQSSERLEHFKIGPISNVWDNYAIHLDTLSRTTNIKIFEIEDWIRGGNVYTFDFTSVRWKTFGSYTESNPHVIRCTIS